MRLSNRQITRSSILLATLATTTATMATSVAHAQIANGFSPGSGFTLNGGATMENNLLTLTDNGGSEARSAFFNKLVAYNNGFAVHFIYTASGDRSADGVAFILQNSASGTNALGQPGGGLGYQGITNSAAVELNLYPQNTIGTTFATNGDTGGYVTTGSVDIASGDAIDVTLRYSSATLTETLLDTVTNATYTTTYATDLASVLGNDGLAYVGFSGGTGGSRATQTVSGFSFVAAPEPSALGLLAGFAPIGGAIARRRLRQRADVRS